jgi:hypothetical protein
MGWANQMASDSEVKVSAEGIFVSCCQGPKRLWEFHPDDVTSIGAYSENGRMHEVIVTVLRHFDVVEGTSGFKELNERLSRELKSEIRVDPKHGTSPLGVVLWPPHLAGGDLWEFYIIGADLLARYVSPDTPDAERGLCGAVKREMAQNAKPRLPEDFPQPLIDRGFAYHGDMAWCKDDAVLAAEWLSAREAAIVDAELWLVKNAIVQPHIQTASGVIAYRYWTTTQPSETWEGFANRALNETTAFIRKFQWPKSANEPAEQEARFCLGWVWKYWLEEDGFSFPK